MDKHKLPLSWPCLPLPIPSPYIIINHWTELLVLYNNFPLASYFIHGSVYMPMLLSQFITSSPSPTVSTNLFSASASLFLPHRETHQYHFSRFHVCGKYGVLTPDHQGGPLTIFNCTVQWYWVHLECGATAVILPQNSSSCRTETLYWANHSFSFPSPQLQLTTLLLSVSEFDNSRYLL